MLSSSSSTEEKVTVRNAIDIGRYSTLTRLLRVTAWVLRWTAVIRSRVTGSEDLVIDEIQEAERIWLRELQQDAYPDELRQLRSGHQIAKQSKIYGLSPFEKDGLLKIKGRLQESDLSSEEKHPIILPTEHEYVRLLILDQHEKTSHGGVQQTLHQLRKRYWIPRGRQVVGKTIRDCSNCKLFNTEPFAQDVAPLPKERVCQRAPFSAVGVDMAGPIYRKGARGSEAQRMWIVLFTCAVIRAIHLELVETLSAEDFMGAFERFSSRRGTPQVVFSDNGLSFKRAASILASRGVAWKFSVPRAPWWGGFWERLVRMTKEALRRTLRRSLLTWQELNTALCKIEAAINARPLTALTDDPDDVRPLSPSDFLHERSCSSEDDVSIFLGKGQNMRDMREHHLQVLQHLWARWKREYLRELRMPMRITADVREPRLGDLVLIEDNPRASRALWTTGRIQSLHPGRDGKARAASVQTTKGILVRPIQRLHLLESTT